MATSFERTLIIIKPDAIQRSLLGEIIHRFERKGLEVIGVKMMQLDRVILESHYVHHKDKPFFDGMAKSMMSCPVVVIALEGINAIKACRIIVGQTYGAEADAGSIRGDLGMSKQANLVHASDSPEAAQDEIKRFFTESELFAYNKINRCNVYGDEELAS